MKSRHCLLTGDGLALPACGISCSRTPSAQEPAGNAVACSRSTGERSICSRPAIRNNWWIIWSGFFATTCSTPTSRSSCNCGMGATSSSANTVNYTLSGRRLDIQLRGAILPGYEDDWERVLVAIEDVTERESARRGSRAERALRARPVRAFAGVAVGRGFHRHQAPARRDARAAASSTSACSPTCIRNSSTRCMSEIRVIDVNQHTLDAVRRARQGDAAQPPRRCLPRRHAAALPRAADRPVGRQAVPAARGGQLRARRQRAASAPAILGAARPRARLVARAGRAHRHHGAQEGRGLSGIPRQARRADQALQPLVLRRRAQSAGAQGAVSGHHHHRRSQRPEGGQRPVGPCRRRRAAAPRRRGARTR